jgi:hypothetical protein
MEKGEKVPEQGVVEEAEQRYFGIADYRSHTD